MQMIDLAEVKCEYKMNKKREKHVKLLMNSIMGMGQMEPIVVNDDLMVIDGRARVIAMRRLNLGHIAAVKASGSRPDFTTGTMA